MRYGHHVRPCFQLLFRVWSRRARLCACLALLLSGAAYAQDPKDSVSKHVSPDDYLKKRREANQGKSNEAENVSPAMAQILQVVTDAFAELGNKGKDCDRAAANLAFSIGFDAYATVGLKGLLNSLKDAVSNIVSAGEKGAADFLADKIKDVGQDAAKEFIRDKLAKDKAEVYVSKSPKNGCEAVLIAIWDKKAGAYDVMVYGDCQCQPQPTGTIRGSTRLRGFAVGATGKVSIGIDDKNAPVLNVGLPKTSIVADCDCAAGKGTPSEEARGATPQAQPRAAAAPAEDPCKIKLQCPKPCKDCEDIHKQITSACDRLDAIDRERRTVAGEVTRNENEQKAAKEAKNNDDLKELQREARKLELGGYALGLEEQRLKQKSKELVQQLKDCEKRCCGQTQPAPKEKTETPSGKPIGQTEQQSQTAHYYLPSGMLLLNPATAPEWWSSPFAPGAASRCDDWCCRSAVPIALQTVGPGLVWVRVTPATDLLGVGRSIHVAYDKDNARYAAETYLRWIASGDSGLTIDLEVQRPGSTTFEKIATSRRANDALLFDTKTPGTYLFRASARDSSGKSSFNTLAVTFPVIESGVRSSSR